MISINDALAFEALFSIFKCLVSNQVSRLRVVCKSWKEIIDENRPFWQLLVTGRKESLEWNQSVLNLFDEKSSSTLKEVFLWLKTRERVDFLIEEEGVDFSQLLSTLQKSKKTPQRLFLSRLNVDGIRLSERFIPHLPEFASLIDLRLCKSMNVHLSRLSQSPERVAGEQSSSPLRILWTATLPGSTQFQSDICQNLSFLVLENARSHSDWRRILSRPAQTLKHLSLELRGSSEGIVPLQFPLQ